MKLLAVDDDPIFLTLLRTTLAQSGYSDLTTADSGAQALAILTTAPECFDALLLDIQMPGMSGIELCRNIRVLSDYRRTPVLMLTAMSEKSYVEDAFAAGATDYLTKPIDKVQIRARIGMVQKLLDERAHARKLAAATPGGGSGPAFAEAFPLDDIAGAIEYVALENYLLTLGNFRCIAREAVGLHIPNAADIYEYSGPEAFCEAIKDVASCVSDCLKTRDFLLAYAGYGDFTCVTSRLQRLDPMQFQQEVNEALADMADLYHEFGAILPRVTVGRGFGIDLLTFAPPTFMLERAIADARKSDPATALGLAAE